MPYSGVYSLFQNLVSGVQLTPEQVNDAAGKHQRVRRALNAWYYNLESGTANGMLVGSYGKDTEIRPPSDVDILFDLPWSVYGRFKDRVGNIQSQLLQEVKSVLEKAFPSTRMRADGQVVVVPFSTYAVEVLPAFHFTSGEYWFPDTNGGGRWRTAKPAAEKDALVRSNILTGGKTTHLIKLAKAWRTYRGATIKSFVLELASQEFLGQWVHNKSDDGRPTGYGYYDFMIRDFFPFLLARKDGYFFVPGTGEMISAGNEWESQARIAGNAAARATSLGFEDKTEAAKSEWKNIFGGYIR